MSLVTDWVDDSKLFNHDPNAAQKDWRTKTDQQLITVNVHLDGKQISSSVEDNFVKQSN